MKKAGLLVAGIILLFQFGCSPKSSSNFELYLTDAPLDGLEHFYITISQIYLKLEDGTWTDNLLTDPRTYDLLQLRNREEKVCQADLPPGTYTGIKLVITRAELVVNGRSFQVDINPPLTITIPVNFTVLEDGTVKVTLDFDAARSAVPEGGGYRLAPIIVVKKIIY
ncbi:MAG: DUF4382 domain-containing protein [Candidatus Saccharicenans sp.]|nr:DUF4382 domain-containing protein [Candidatus Saccharicenans sp.]